MTDANPQPTRQRFALTADMPIRPYLIAAAASSLGALVVILWAWRALPTAVLVVGVALMAFGVVLLLAAYVISKRLRSVLTLDDSAITVTRGRSARRLLWSDIAEVRLAGPRMILIPKSGGARAMQIINPGGSSASSFQGAAEAIQNRLDADRGYTNLD